MSFLEMAKAVRAGLPVAQPSHESNEVTKELPAASSAAVEMRMIAFRRQLDDWNEAERQRGYGKTKEQTAPPFALPSATLLPRTCLICGDPLAAERAFRCGPCVEAIRLVLPEIGRAPR